MDASSRAVRFLENEHRLRNSMQTLVPHEPDLLHPWMSSSAVYRYILRSGEIIPFVAPLLAWWTCEACIPLGPHLLHDAWVQCGISCILVCEPYMGCRCLLTTMQAAMLHRKRRIAKDSRIPTVR